MVCFATTKVSLCGNNVFVHLHAQHSLQNPVWMISFSAEKEYQVQMCNETNEQNKTVQSTTSSFGTSLGCPRQSLAAVVHVAPRCTGTLVAAL